MHQMHGHAGHDSHTHMTHCSYVCFTVQQIKSWLVQTKIPKLRAAFQQGACIAMAVS